MCLMAEGLLKDEASRCVQFERVPSTGGAQRSE